MTCQGDQRRLKFALQTIEADDRRSASSSGARRAIRDAEWDINETQMSAEETNMSSPLNH